MHKTTLANLLGLTLVASMLPLAMADPGTYDHFEDTQAPVGVYLKDLGPTALAFCFLNETMPASCDPQPGAIPALGGAFFEVDPWNAQTGADTSYGRHVRINVEQTSGQVLGGFAALACTDYNDDIECDSGSNGVSDDDCASGKDDKDCADPTNLELHFCAEKDDYTYTLIHDDGTIEEGLVDDLYDDFVVFVTAWVDVADDDAGGLDLLDNEADNTGVGASVGQFRVYADWSGQTGFSDQAGCGALNDVVIAHAGSAPRASATCTLNNARGEGYGDRFVSASASMYFQTSQSSSAGPGYARAEASGSGGGKASGYGESWSGAWASASCDTTIVGQILDPLGAEGSSFALGCSVGGAGSIVGRLVDAGGVYWVVGEAFASPLGTFTADAVGHRAPAAFEETGLSLEVLFEEDSCSAVLY